MVVQPVGRLSDQNTASKALPAPVPAAVPAGVPVAEAAPWRRWGVRLGGVGVAVALLTALATRVGDVGAVFDALSRGISPIDVALLGALTVAQVVTGAWGLVAALPGLSMRDAAKVNVTSTAVAYSLPAGGAAGAAAQVTMLRRLGFDGREVATQLAVTGLWGTTVKLVLPVVALAALAWGPGAPAGLSAAAAAGAGMAVVVLAVAAAALAGDGAARAIGRVAARGLGPACRRLHRGDPAIWPERMAAFSARTRRVARRRWLGLTASTLAYNAVLWALLVVALRAAGARGVSPLEALAVLAVARQLSALPITPGGTGVVEVGLVGGLRLAGGALPAVTAAVLVYRLLTYAAYLPLGLPMWFAVRRGPAAPLAPPAMSPAPAISAPAALPPARHRHPGDVFRLVGALGVLVGLGVAAYGGRVVRAEADLFRLVNGLPDGLLPVLSPIMQAGTLGAVFGAGAIALLARQRRLAVDLVAAGWVTWTLAKGVKLVVHRSRPGTLLPDVILRGGAPATGHGYVSGHAAVSAALVTVAGAALPRPARRALWGVAGVVALARVYVGAHLPFDVVGGAAFGVMVAAGLQLARGVPVRVPSTASVIDALASLGLPGAAVANVSVDARGSVPLAATVGRRELFVKALGRDQRDADLLFKLGRFVLFRELEDEAPFATAKQLVEHEAYLTLLAARAGVRVPAVVGTAPAGGGSVLLVLDRLDAVPLGTYGNSDAEIGDAVLADLWEQVEALHRAGIAHRDLRRANVLVGTDGRVHLIDFGFAEAGATRHRMDQDVAELVASTAVAVGAETAVCTARTALGSERLAAAVPLLRPLALATATRAELRRRPGLLERVREEAAASSGCAPPGTGVNVRVRPAAMLALLLSTVAVHHLIIGLAGFGEVGRVLGALRWRWLVVAAAAAATTYGAAAVTLMAATGRALAFGRTVAAELAASFGAMLRPGADTATATTMRYLEAGGVEREDAASALATRRAARFAAHGAALVIAAVLAVRTGLPRRHLPAATSVLLAAALAAALAGLAWWRPLRRRAAFAGFSRALARLPSLTRSPSRAVELTLAVVGAHVAELAALVASLEATGVRRFSLAPAVAGFLLIQAAAPLGPLPRGLGVVEPGLVVVLSAAGVPLPSAVVAVLVFRVVTYWLPLLPGAVAWRHLRADGCC
ncbi:MAG: flippase-like domain-containing protein [Actinobacteria bacterium]|nr:flippase-like domain-containing protein [Actinomycetota bacterium]